MVLGSFPDLCVTDVGVSVAFYRSLLGLHVVADQEWYVELGIDQRTLLAVVQAGHPTVPPESGAPARGLLVSFDVDELTTHARAAANMGCPFVVEPVAELGQRHFMVLDRDGTVVDVIERIPFTRPDRDRLARYRRAHRRRHRHGHGHGQGWGR